MRNAFSQALVEAARRPDFVFLTGDLGFKALEPLREALGPRFINAGVAEQNMVSVAAGLARSGLRPWVYSIAPFIYARPYEQIRNDVCLQRLPVVLVGNGGGYGYGVMGATHHALEDYGSLLCLPNLRAYVPAFDADVSAQVESLFSISHPAYLRLGAAEEPGDAAIPGYAPWRKLQDGPGWLILVTGPLVGGIWQSVRELRGPRRPTLWVLSELPCDPIPKGFQADLARSGRLLVVEEHVSQGGVAQNLAFALLSAGQLPARFAARSAQGYPSGRYGSQKFHRGECGLDPGSIVNFLISEGARNAA
ncbi:MAG: transketolase family protein [Isosphaeraceae bacterium]